MTDDNPQSIVEIDAEPIELYKVLKLADIAQSGGEAKCIIADGLVLVNGEVETKKRKKIVSGDTIECEGITVQIRVRQ